MVNPRKSTSEVTEEMIDRCLAAMQRKGWLYTGWKRDRGTEIRDEVRYFLKRALSK